MGLGIRHSVRMGYTSIHVMAESIMLCINGQVENLQEGISHDDVHVLDVGFIGKQ